MMRAASLRIEDLITYELTTERILPETELLFQSLIPIEEVDGTLASLIESKILIRRSRFLILKSVWDESIQRTLEAVESFHRQNQHLASMPLAILTSESDLPHELFEFVLESLISSNKLDRVDAGVRIKAHAAGLNPQQETIKNQLLDELRNNRRLALTRDDLLAYDKDAKKIYGYLKQQNEIVDAAGTIFLKTTFDRLSDTILRYLKQHGKITVAEARDLTDTSRKIILPLLEELDRLKITKREGDFRTLCDSGN